MPRKNNAPWALAASLTNEWMILPENLQRLISTVNEGMQEVNAVETRQGRPVENTAGVTVRDGVAIISITGPIFRYDNWMTYYLGFPSVQSLALDLETVLNDSKVKSILWNIDSPGGQASGIAEFADIIYNARGKKPMAAYVSMYGCSAAYWIASAASEIVMGETAAVGSIGTVLTISKKKDEETLEIVSTQSPDKRPDYETEEGVAKVQAYVDELAAIFIAKVARNRGVTEEKVLRDFGKGDILVGQKAVDAGLADRIGSFESLVSELSAKSKSTVVKKNDGGKKPTMDLTTLMQEHPELYAQVVEQSALAERNRIQGIEAQLLPGHEDLIASLKFDGKTTPEQASMKVLAAEKALGPKTITQIASEAPRVVTQPAAEVATKPEAAAATAPLSRDEKLKKEWESDSKLQAEFDLEGYIAYQKVAARERF